MIRKKRKSARRIIKSILVLVILSGTILFWGRSLYSMATNKEPGFTGPSITPLIPTVSSPPDEKPVIYTDEDHLPIIDSLVSNNAVLINIDTQKVLYDKNGDETIYPASLTKIMTAIVALENLEDLNQSVTLSSGMFKGLYKEGASMAGFLPGETVPAIDLLYGMLLPSGAECCIGLAGYISGSEDAFVDLMNEKAKALGMENTHFTNVTGLHSSEHYTTVEDLALLLEYCLRSDTFREIFTSEKHSTEATNLHPGGITFYSTLFKNMTPSELRDNVILGGKTGYTAEAGLCLASLAKIHGKEYILITAGADGDHSTVQYDITDAFLIYSKLE